MKYQQEKLKLKKALGETNWDILKEAKAFIAGGAITSLFTNSPINDLDIYFRDRKDCARILAEVMSDSYFSESDFSLHIQFYTDRSILCSHSGDNPLQFIAFRGFPCVQDIFDTFDFTVCMGAFDFETEEFVLHEEFLKHNSQKYLKFNTGTAFPLISALRINKYRDKGYYISKPEFLRCMLTCAQLDLTSWEDAISHIGGMYGYALEEMFDQEKEFSIDELICQLDKVFESEIPHTLSDLEIKFDDIMEKVFPDIVEEVDRKEEELMETDNTPKFDTDKYYYKCTNEFFKSHYRGNISYEEGVTVNGGPGGIFVHSDVRYPYLDTEYWVELEHIGPGDVKKNGGETILFGDVKVIRQFFYDRNSDERYDAWRAVLFPEGTSNESEECPE